MAPAKILCVVAARPNFMKMAPLIRAFRAHPQFEARLVHTGQHYDEKLSDGFFRDLEIPVPHYNLEVGSANHAEQTARVMSTFFPVMEREKPSAVLVVGDVNSTLACALVAVKEHIPVIHVEAGLRSGDRRMPEEINRLLTDQISHFLFTTSEEAEGNLRRENCQGEIHFCGNLMIDSLLFALPRARELKSKFPHFDRGEYSILTLHRPANVDDPGVLRHLLEFLRREAADAPLIFPLHPRTRDRLKKMAGLGDYLPFTDDIFKVQPERGKIHAVDPLGYHEMLFLVANSRYVYTDSGGLQEESTALGVPCLTLRENTERPVTLTCGTNILGGTTPESLAAGARKLRALRARGGPFLVPPLWDGKTAERIVGILSVAHGEGRLAFTP